MTDNVASLHAERSGFEPQQAELADRVIRRTHGDGVHATAIAGLTLVRASTPSQPLPTVYHPSLCVVVQGRKRALLAGRAFVYDPLHHLVVSLSLPVTGQILEASAARPYLCLRIDIDVPLVNQLARELGPAAPAPSPEPLGLFLARTGGPLLDAVLRLVRLLDAPQDAAVLAPLALREIHYRILVGDFGPRLRGLCDVGAPSQQIARAIELVKERYAEPLRIGEIAEAAHMSPSALHARFKAATRLSPLQYQKQLRLQEARRLMLAEGIEAAAAGYRVGYESPSQFSREYRRLFGAPPRREVSGVLATERA